jgi:tetratricopeptide (TPR) repeat protein
VQFKLERYSDALNNWLSALEISQSTGNRSLEAEVLKNLAELYHQTKQHQLAQEYCEAALQIATELGIPLVKECEELLLKIEGERNNSE